MKFSEFYPEYFTATILGWQPLLQNEDYKQIITGSLAFLAEEGRIKVYGFVIMNNPRLRAGQALSYNMASNG